MEIYLQTFGSRLRVKDGIYEVIVPDISGSNHHVEEQFPTHEVTRIMLQPGTSVSTDALLLALESQTDILILDKFGHPQGRFWSNKPSSTIQTWKKQLAISLTPQAIRFARDWIATKLRDRLAFLRELKSHRSGDKVALIEKAEEAIGEQLQRLLQVPIGTDTKAATERIRGHEGTAGRIYYQTLSMLLPKEYQFKGRSRPAQDLFNAFLNYGLGILYKIVEKALHIAGINPYIGFMHHDGYKDQSMVFDYIEQYRIWVDRTVFKLFSRKLPTLASAEPRSEKGVWLNEEGKRLIRTALQQQLDNKRIERKGKTFPIEQFIVSEASSFATVIRDFKSPTAFLS